MFFCVNLLLFFTVPVFVLRTNAKPTNDFVLNDNDETEDNDRLLRLNEILRSDNKSNFLDDGNGFVVQDSENGKLFEGDILLVQRQEYLLTGDEDAIRTGRANEFYRWPKDEDSNVIVPYNISLESEYSENLINYGLYNYGGMF